MASDIRALRREGRRGFKIQSDVESIDDELTVLSAKIEAWEAANSINIGTNVGSFDGGAGAMRRGGGSLRSTSSPISALHGVRGEGLMDTLSNLRRSFGEMAENSEITNINMSDMHNILARLVPVLLVFLGAIPAAVTAIYTLAAAAFSAAAAFAAMAGLGALGLAMEDGQFNMQNLTDAFAEARQDFLDAFTPLANELQPLFEDALAGLETFFDAVAAQGDVLLALEDEARAFGGFILEFVPEALRTLGALVSSMSSIFGGMASSLQRNFTSAVADLVQLTALVVPALADFANTIGRAMPTIIRMSLGFLMVADAIIRVLGGLGRLLGMLGVSPTVLGAVTAALLSFISTAALGSSIIGSVFVSSLLSAIGSLYTFILSAHGATGALGVLGSTMLGTALSALVNFVSGIITSIGALFGFTIASYQAAAAAAALVTILTLGTGLAIVGLAMSAAASFTSLAGSIDSATSSLKDFKSIQSGMDGTGFDGGSNPYGYDPDDPRGTAGGGSNISVFNVESSGDPEEDRSNMEHADWMSGRSTGGG